MRNDFQSNGEIEFTRAKESELWKSIKKKYADELAAAFWLKKWKIKIQIYREFSRRRKEEREPSPGILW